ncbi:MAG: SDR family NAD(P)-dependent oxidoreductase [Planctomycetota bacterium]|nr:SDR family NAD(P)-dependent oxidoreductase [Planctomycetota bacterium]
MSNKSFHEQTALITGGGSGIGRVMAHSMLEAGFGTVLIASRRGLVLRETCDSLARMFPKQRVVHFEFDIRVRSQVEDLVEFAKGQIGVVDVLINNSGLAVPEAVESITEDGWNTVLETNLRGVMWLTQLLLPGMKAQNFGDIVNVASQAGKHGYADVPSYCASKFGLLGFAESVRDDVCRRGLNIRIVNLCPALVDVESDPETPPRPGFLHVRTMAQTLIYCLSLDRNVVLHDIGLSGR